MTREELRIIEQTKRQAEEYPELQKPSKWASVKSALLFVVIFLLFVLCAYLIVAYTAR